MDLVKIVVDWMSGMEIPGGVDPWSTIMNLLLKGKEQDQWILNWSNGLLNMFIEWEQGVV